MNLVAMAVAAYGILCVVVSFYWIFTCYKKQNSLYLSILKTAYPLMVPVLVYLICILLI
jgi:hypothetical protein